MLIDGIHVPLTAPFTRDGDLFLTKLAADVRRYSLSPVSGIIAFAPAAESGSLSFAELNDCWQTIRTAAAPEKVLTAHITQDSVANTVLAAERAFDCGFDVALLAAPASWPLLERFGPSQALPAFFLTVADRSPLPILLYSSGLAPALALTADFIAALARHPNIVGLIDDGLSPESLSALRHATAGIQHESTVTTTFRPVTRRMLASQPNGDLLPVEQLIAGATPRSPHPLPCSRPAPKSTASPSCTPAMPHPCSPCCRPAPTASLPRSPPPLRKLSMSPTPPSLTATPHSPP